jgi:hypothetical protein
VQVLHIPSLRESANKYPVDATSEAERQQQASVWSAETAREKR